MKTLTQYLIEALAFPHDRNLRDIAKIAELNADKPFYFLVRIPKKKEFHIYDGSSYDDLEKMYIRTKDEPLEFGRFEKVNNDKEKIIKYMKMPAFKGNKIIDHTEE